MEYGLATWAGEWGTHPLGGVLCRLSVTLYLLSSSSGGSYPIISILHLRLTSLLADPLPGTIQEAEPARQNTHPFNTVPPSKFRPEASPRKWQPILYIESLITCGLIEHHPLLKVSVQQTGGLAVLAIPAREVAWVQEFATEVRCDGGVDGYAEEVVL